MHEDWPAAADNTPALFSQQPLWPCQTSSNIWGFLCLHSAIVSTCGWYLPPLVGFFDGSDLATYVAQIPEPVLRRPFAPWPMPRPFRRCKPLRFTGCWSDGCLKVLDLLHHKNHSISMRKGPYSVGVILRKVHVNTARGTYSALLPWLCMTVSYCESTNEMHEQQPTTHQIYVDCWIRTFFERAFSSWCAVCASRLSAAGDVAKFRSKQGGFHWRVAGQNWARLKLDDGHKTWPLQSPRP